MVKRSIERLLFACRWLLAPLSVGLHLTFVISAVLPGVLDRMAFATHRNH